MRNPYIPEAMYESDSGSTIQLRDIWNIANKALKTIMSELPEEAQTHDIVERVLSEASMQLNGMKVTL